MTLIDFDTWIESQTTGSLSTLLRDPVALLQALIRIPSPNPPGDTRQITRFLSRLIEAMHVTPCVYTPPGKTFAPSVVAAVGSGAPVVLMHAHIDTVPIAEDESARWTVDPYGGVIRDGRIYGKGSIDDKAPLAAMLHALGVTAARREHLRGTLVLVAAAEEETGGVLGTKWLAENGLLPMSDFIVVGEQTGNRVANAHKGVVRAMVRATGRSVHATNPDRGVNAITAMAKAVLALDAYHQALAERVHPQVGVPTCNVGVIEGGSTANAVPDTCIAWLDRRMIPGEDPARVQQELIDVIAGVDAGEAALTISEFQVSNWFASPVDGPLAEAFVAQVRAAGIDPGPVGYLPGSDAKHLTGRVKPDGRMIIFGPGSYEVAHAADEYTEIEALHTTAQILSHFCERVLLTGEGGSA
jgi:acetylornithine deacetylase/succinyl-diaminopimelate desuccinylase-like protein